MFGFVCDADVSLHFCLMSQYSRQGSVRDCQGPCLHSYSFHSDNYDIQFTLQELKERVTGLKLQICLSMAME